MAKPATPTEFRQLLGRFASGVTVITAAQPDGRVAGMTATAVSSVSLEPPLLLVCINHHDPLHEFLADSSCFAVNVLAADQIALSERFAGDVEHRFRNLEYDRGPGGVPLLGGVVAHVVCEPWQSFLAGDHTIHLGLVTGGFVFDRAPLLHYQGAYLGGQS